MNANKSADEIFRRYPGLSDMVQAYLQCALFTSYSLGDMGDSDYLDDCYSIEDFAKETEEKARKQCAVFFLKNRELCEQAIELYKWHEDAPTGWHSLGYDFWFTRNHHGAGFWDRSELGKCIGEALTTAAQAFTEVDAIIGDDGLIYIE